MTGDYVIRKPGEQEWKTLGFICGLEFARELLDAALERRVYIADTAKEADLLYKKKATKKKQK